MWRTEHTEMTTATPRQLWSRYSDPTTWPTWDQETVDVTVDGPFAVGTRGTIKPVGGPKAAFTFTEVTPLVSFTDTTRLPFTTITFTHTIEDLGVDGCRFTHGLTIEGLLTPVFSRLIGRKVAASLPEAMRRLAQLAERTAAEK